MKTTIFIEWKKGPVKGRVQVSSGKILRGDFIGNKGTCSAGGFRCDARAACRLRLTLEGTDVDPGAGATRVGVLTAKDPFTFFLRDVRAGSPIFIPAYGVAISLADEGRTYHEIEVSLRSRGLRTKLATIGAEPEESYEEASRHTRTMWCPTWLGIGRDNRIFEINFQHEGMPENVIIPRGRPRSVSPEELDNKPLEYHFAIGRGVGCEDNTTRRLDEGVLPILHTDVVDDEVRYECTGFASLERKALIAGNIRGTHFLYADGHLLGHMLNQEQQQRFDKLIPREEAVDEEVVLYFRARAVNTGPAPRLAFFKALTFYQLQLPSIRYDSATGQSAYKTGRVFSVSKFNGRPMPQEEMAVLLGPGETATMEFYVPHGPINAKRATALARQDFDQRLRECRAFWKEKLADSAEIRLPEKRIDEMVRAGLLHLDLVTYGLEPAGTLAATIGIYNPIGSESSPIIQFNDSMARHRIAERSLQYFLDKQHDDGFMQNFADYMLETGAALWSMGEHYRYTHDEAWVKRIKPHLLKACEYLDRWRKRNQTPALVGRGYGLMDGKVADPEDPFRIFMLNGYSYLGLSRVAEMLAKVDPARSRQIRAQAAALKKDIRKAFFDSLARGPAVPLSDGTWIPTAAPWVEAVGPSCLFAEDTKCYSHGTFTGRDAMLGPIYLVLQEVIDPRELASDFLIDFQSDVMCLRNTVFSQPYYSPHPYVHLKRGEIKAFLKAYYNTFSGLADRQTYTFWEHFFHISPHKTHEESWFLMQTRWMLYMEDGSTLKLLPGIPRRWLEDGQTIEVKNAASYFGPLSLKVVSCLHEGWIEAAISCPASHRPQSVEIRLPHPQGQKAIAVTGGKYHSNSEAVRIEKFIGKTLVKVMY